MNRYNNARRMKFGFNRLVKHILKNWQHPATAWMLSILWLTIICALAFFWNLGSIGLIDETEPLFAEASRQMIVTGDWITPFYNGVPRFDKPPLIYWCQAIAYQVFGVSEWAVRLPSALAALALTGIVFYTLRRFGTPLQAAGTTSYRGEVRIQNSEFRIQKSELRIQPWLVASLGAAMTALNLLTISFGRTGYSDMLLSACFGGALCAFFLGYAHQGQRAVQRRWYFTFYVLAALAVLTKGPVGVVLPVLIIGFFLLYVGKAKEVLQEMHLVRGTLIFFTLSLPWYILVIWRNGEAYIDSFFGRHNFERFTSVVNHHQGPWYFHFLVVLLGFMPWSIALPAAIAKTRVFYRQRWCSSPRSSHLSLFALFWFLVVLIFFTLAATKYFSYTLPLMPAAAILVALWWGEESRGSRGTSWGSISTSVLTIVLFLVLAGACFYCPQWLGDDPSMPNLGLRMQQAGLPRIGAIIWSVSAIALTVLLLRRQTRWLWNVKFLGFVAFLTFFIIPTLGIIDVERQLPLRQIAQSIVQVRTAEEEIVMITNVFKKPSMVFYTQQPVTFLHSASKAIPHIQQAKQLPNSQTLLLIATHKSLRKSELTPNQYQKIAEAGEYVLLRVFTANVPSIANS